ncbi:hypothetical protein AHF37_05034 [Paragonimus kellicotti]|nr:hypothetical protein AHF37_05034 [Paragonimus kellicotti]
MAHAPKRSRYDAVGAATAQFYNITGTVPGNIKLPTDVSYLVTTQPSCTIVVIELPTGCTEQDLIGLFSRYGPVKNAKLVCNGYAGLVEFCEISSPTRLVHAAKINPFYVGSNHVRLEFSTESVLPSMDRKIETKASAPEDEATRILHLDIAAANYSITVDVIKAICEPHGKLLRIFIGKKNVDSSLEVLVEFESVEDAKKAKEHLDGADIYSGCCSLTVTYSKLQKVHVTKNDVDSWDFTGPNANVEGPLNTNSGQRTLLSSTAPLVSPSQTVSGTTTILPTPYPQPAPVYMPPPNPTPAAIPSSISKPPMPYYGLPPYGPPHAYPMPPAGQYASVPQYQAYYNAPVQQPPAMPAVRSVKHTVPFQPPAQVTILPTPAPVHQVTPGGIGIGHATSNLNSSSISARQADLSLFESVEGVVLMACNLPPTLNCDHLFNLLCIYGNIARIKFLKSRRGCAMVQVGNAEAADFIHRHYNGISIFGYTIQFHHSKQRELTEHENLGNLEDGSPVMKNYMMDPNNRFRNAVVAAKSRILEPSRTLHFFNAPLNFSPEDVCRVFTDSGAVCPPRVVLFSAKTGQKTSLGLAEWDTLSEALEALVLANQRPIYISGIVHPFHLKLAFSPKPISTDRAGLSLIQYPAPPFAATRPGTESQTVAAMDNFAAGPPEEEDELDAKDEAAQLANGVSIESKADQSQHPSNTNVLSSTNAASSVNLNNSADDGKAENFANSAQKSNPG